MNGKLAITKLIEIIIIGIVCVLSIFGTSFFYDKWRGFSGGQPLPPSQSELELQKLQKSQEALRQEVSEQMSKLQKIVENQRCPVNLPIPQIADPEKESKNILSPAEPAKQWALGPIKTDKGWL